MFRFMKIAPKKHGKWHFRGPENKNFLREHAPIPPSRLTPSALIFPFASCAYLDRKTTLGGGGGGVH